jgi:hypothetical protein
MCGGSWSSFLSGAIDTVKNVASNPMVQQLAQAAAPHAMAAAQRYAPGLVSKAQSAMGTARALAAHPMARAAMAHPMGQAAMGAVRSRLGMGRRGRRGGFGWGDVMNFGKSAVSAVQSAASNPMLQQLAQAAAPHAMAAAQRYAPGLVSKAQSAMGTARSLAAHPMARAAMAHPMGQAAMGAVRSRLGMGRRRKAHPQYGAMLPLGNASIGEQGYAQMRASGGKGGPGGLAMAGQVLGAIPGAAEALGPFGAMLGIEAPPPPPPHASFGAVRQGPQMSARPRGVGRGRRGKRGGFGWGDVMDFGKSAVSAVQSAASNPMLQQLAQAAAPHAMAAAQRYAPGLVSKAQSALGTARSLAAHPMARAAMAHPMGQAAMGAVRSRLGMGRKKRGPTAHSLAVGHVMKQTGMGLGQASRYVKDNGLAY